MLGKSLQVAIMVKLKELQKVYRETIIKQHAKRKSYSHNKDLQLSLYGMSSVKMHLAVHIPKYSLQFFISAVISRSSHCKNDMSTCKDSGADLLRQVLITNSLPWLGANLMATTKNFCAHEYRHNFTINIRSAKYKLLLIYM